MNVISGSPYVSTRHIISSTYELIEWRNSEVTKGNYKKAKAIQRAIDSLCKRRFKT